MIHLPKYFHDFTNFIYQDRKIPVQSCSNTILPWREQGAGHMAEGYARVYGLPGVVLVTSGPGATNVVTPCKMCFPMVYP